jgi:hypothetical protein
MVVKILKLYKISNRRVVLNHSMFHCLQILGAPCFPLVGYRCLVFSVACRMDDDLQCFRASWFYLYVALFCPYFLSHVF